MPSARHANTAKVKYCKPSCYFPINPRNGICLLGLLRKPAGSTDAFPCLFYFSQPLTALHNCHDWLVSALALTGSKFLHRVENIPYSLLERAGIFRSSCRTPLTHLTSESQEQSGLLQTPLKVNECLALSGGACYE